MSENFTELIVLPSLLPVLVALNQYVCRIICMATRASARDQEGFVYSTAPWFLVIVNKIWSGYLWRRISEILVLHLIS